MKQSGDMLSHDASSCFHSLQENLKRRSRPCIYSYIVRFHSLQENLKLGSRMASKIAGLSGFHSLQENLKHRRMTTCAKCSRSFHSLQENLKQGAFEEVQRSNMSFPFLTGKFEAFQADMMVASYASFHSLQENLKRGKISFTPPKIIGFHSLQENLKPPY